MRKWFVAAAVILIAICGRTAASSAQNDPLPSWNNGATKKSITDFVAHVTAPGAAGFVPVPQRIATFDNDGTLWTEKPIYFQVIFALDRIRTMAPQHPEWKRKLPFKAAIDHDMAALSASGTKGLLEIVGASQGGLSPEEYDKTVLAWLAVARHPRFDKPYTDLVYQPMLGAARLSAQQRLQDFHRLGRRRRFHAGLDSKDLRHSAGASRRFDRRLEVRDEPRRGSGAD